MKNLYLIPVIVLGLVFTSWTDFKKVKVAYDGVKEILGAGATFPYPYYSKLFDEYNKKTGIKVNYQSIGSGGGIKQLQAKTVDFGASDAPMSDDELKATAPIVHIPTCLGADVITYNLPGVTTPLKFTGDVVAILYFLFNMIHILSKFSLLYEYWVECGVALIISMSKSLYLSSRLLYISCR